MKETNNEPLGIFTFDYSFGSDVVVPEDHQLGSLIKLVEYETINIESFKNKGVDYIFTLDSDIIGM